METLPCSLLNQVPRIFQIFDQMCQMVDRIHAEVQEIKGFVHRQEGLYAWGSNLVQTINAINELLCSSREPKDSCLRFLDQFRGLGPAAVGLICVHSSPKVYLGERRVVARDDFVRVDWCPLMLLEL
jgi:hypothetical protein